MFNITNAAEVERFGAKPSVQEIGPFTYRMKLQKQQILFHENQTVSYKEVKTWLFDRSLSAMDESTVITTVNTPLVSTLTVLQRVPPAVRVLITLALDTITEGDLLVNDKQSFLTKKLID
jgi:scavenger receptor class B protein 1